MNEPIIELLRKIKALADKGVGGEKENAERKLRALMAKHKITMAELEQRTVHAVSFRYKTGLTHIVSHIIWSVSPDIKLFGHRQYKNAIIADVDSFQELEIRYLIDIYTAAWLKEVVYLQSAFIIKNNLDYKGDAPSNPKELTDDERRKIANLAKGVDVTQRNKALNK